ncbi:Ba158.2 [Baboon cytomegalovirus]|nr:Ba158.2 [Baboon cytomegalovirus]
MNVYAIPVALMLVSAAFIPQGFATPHSVAPTCCTTFVNKPIPRQLLKGYIEVINSRCPRKAVIFKTKLGKEICAKPHEKHTRLDGRKLYLNLEASMCKKILKVSRNKKRRKIV